MLNKKWLVEHIQNNDGRLDQEIQNKIVGHLTPMVEAAKGNRLSEQGANRSPMSNPLSLEAVENTRSCVLYQDRFRLGDTARITTLDIQQ